MALLGILHEDPKLTARIKSSIQEHHDLQLANSWSELRDFLEKREVDGCIIDIYSPVNPLSLSDLGTLREIHPFAAIIVYSDFAGREPELYQLGVIGVNEVILSGRNDGSWQIMRAVSSALNGSVAAHVSHLIEGQLNEIGLRALAWAIRHSGHSPTPPSEAFAKGLGYQYLQLQRLLRSQGLPSAREFLIWGRIFKAIGLLELTRKTREDVAFSVGYVSMSSMNRAFKGAAGHTVDQVMNRGGLTFVVQCFIDRHGTKVVPEDS